MSEGIVEVFSGGPTANPRPQGIASAEAGYSLRRSLSAVSFVIVSFLVPADSGPPKNWSPLYLEGFEERVPFQTQDLLLDAFVVPLGPSVPYSQPPSNWAPRTLEPDPAEASNQLLLSTWASEAARGTGGGGGDIPQPPSTTGWNQYLDADQSQLVVDQLLDAATTPWTATLPVVSVPTAPLVLDVDVVQPAAAPSFDLVGFFVPATTPTPPANWAPLVLDADQSPSTIQDVLSDGIVMPFSTSIPYIPPAVPWFQFGLEPDSAEAATVWLQRQALEAIFGFTLFDTFVEQPPTVPLVLDVDVYPPPTPDLLLDAIAVPFTATIPVALVPTTPLTLDVEVYPSAASQDQLLDFAPVSIGPSVPYVQPPPNWAPLTLEFNEESRSSQRWHGDQVLDATIWIPVALAPPLPTACVTPAFSYITATLPLFSYVSAVSVAFIDACGNELVAFHDGTYFHDGTIHYGGIAGIGNCIRPAFTDVCGSDP